MSNKFYFFFLAIFLIGSCSDETTTSAIWVQPSVDTTWQIQLSGTVNTEYNVGLYDIDLFDVSTAKIAGLKARGIIVICYFSGGSYEDWRSDESSFSAVDLGNELDGWEGENWLDITSARVRAVMLTRLDLAKAKGCDGVDPDNMNGYDNDTGFDLTAAEQLAYNIFMANAAHSRGLAVGLKNDLDQVAELVSYFDFQVNEQCYQYDECSLLFPFIAAGKPVFNIEYNAAIVSDPTDLCADAASWSFRSLVMPLLLDDTSRTSCD
ncbi:MAG: endo alpha-1,4 polygalactosaminidase [SAR324 cluster bacterium]|nr:endo alpha-1,4 polygalactosaminidase [SAR324 cluster bacterium]